MKYYNLCTHKHPLQYLLAFVYLYVQRYLEGNTLLTVTASSKHTKATVCSPKYPGWHWKQIRFGYSLLEIPSGFSSHWKPNQSNFQFCWKGPKDLVPATSAVAIPTALWGSMDVAVLVPSFQQAFSGHCYQHWLLWFETWLHQTCTGPLAWSVVNGTSLEKTSWLPAHLFEPSAFLVPQFWSLN